MAYDPLAKYRPEVKETASTASPVELPDMAGDEYVAFKAVDREVKRLRVIRAGKSTRTPSNAYLQEVASDGAYGTKFVLSYAFMVVSVTGKNLLPVIAAVERDQATFIQEFDSKKWKLPAEPAAPVIEKIEVTVHRADAMDGESPQSVEPR